MLRPHPLQAPWATDLGVSAGPPGPVRPGFRLASHLLRSAGQHYRGKLGDSAGRTSTGSVHGVTGCTQEGCKLPQAATTRFDLFVIQGENFLPVLQSSKCPVTEMAEALR
jgi:hypothetical protein